MTNRVTSSGGESDFVGFGALPNISTPRRYVQKRAAIPQNVDAVIDELANSRRKPPKIPETCQPFWTRPMKFQFLDQQLKAKKLQGDHGKEQRAKVDKAQQQKLQVLREQEAERKHFQALAAKWEEEDKREAERKKKEKMQRRNEMKETLIALEVAKTERKIRRMERDAEELREEKRINKAIIQQEQQIRKERQKAEHEWREAEITEKRQKDLKAVKLDNAMDDFHIANWKARLAKQDLINEYRRGIYEEVLEYNRKEKDRVADEKRALEEARREEEREMLEHQAKHSRIQGIGQVMSDKTPVYTDHTGKLVFRHCHTNQTSKVSRSLIA